MVFLRGSWKIILIGLAIILFFGYVLLGELNFYSTAQKTTGVVTGIKLIHNMHENTDAPVVDFNTLDGKQITYTSTISSSFIGAGDIGKTISISYDPKNPSNARIDEWYSPITFAASMVGVGVLVVVLGFIYYLKNKGTPFVSP